MRKEIPLLPHPVGGKVMVGGLAAGISGYSEYGVSKGDRPGEAESSDAPSKAETAKKTPKNNPMQDPKVRDVVRQLQRIDQEVRAHEAAHMAAGGAYVRGGPTYTYRTGPDGKRYAVGGEVQIDTSPVPNNPEATLRKMEAVRRAATSPAKPSAQDMQVAAGASQAMSQAQMQLNQKRMQETKLLRGDLPSMDVRA